MLTCMDMKGDRIVYPKIKTLADYTGMSERQVRYGLSILSTKNIIKDAGLLRNNIHKRFINLPSISPAGNQQGSPAEKQQYSPAEIQHPEYIKEYKREYKKKYIKKNNNQRRIKESLVTQSYDGDI